MWPGLTPPADQLLRQLPEGGHIPGGEAQQIPAFLRGKGLSLQGPCPAFARHTRAKEKDGLLCCQKVV